MERGVNSTGCKQRGRFFDVKRGSLHCKETPSSNWRRRFFYLNNMPTCRDRRPRLSAKAQQIKRLPKPLRRRGCCLTGYHVRINGRTDEGVCPYRFSIVSHRTNNLLTCQLSTRQLYLITILNCELCILNCTRASASVDSHVPLGTLCRLQASCHLCIPC